MTLVIVEASTVQVGAHRGLQKTGSAKPPVVRRVSLRVHVAPKKLTAQTKRHLNNSQNTRKGAPDNRNPMV